MSKFQLLTAHINIGGERGNVAVKTPFEPITFPEALVLQTIHGGQEHVHTMSDVGSVERSMDEEYRRLESIYGGKIVNALFPGVAGRVALPQGDDTIPTLDEVQEAAKAAEEAIQRRRAAKAEGKEKPAKPAIPAPADL